LREGKRKEHDEITHVFKTSQMTLQIYHGQKANEALYATWRRAPRSFPAPISWSPNSAG